jgi:hypothetical protein
MSCACNRASPCAAGFCRNVQPLNLRERMLSDRCLGIMWRQVLAKYMERPLFKRLSRHAGLRCGKPQFRLSRLRSAWIVRFGLSQSAPGQPRRAQCRKGQFSAKR